MIKKALERIKFSALVVTDDMLAILTAVAAAVTGKGSTEEPEII